MSEDLNLARTAVSPRRMLVPSPHPARERAGKEPLLSTGLFRNRTSNPGLVTQKTGTILVSDLASGNQSYALAMASLTAIGLLGLVAAMWLPSNPVPADLTLVPGPNRPNDHRRTATPYPPEAREWPSGPQSASSRPGTVWTGAGWMLFAGRVRPRLVAAGGLLTAVR